MKKKIIPKIYIKRELLPHGNFIMTILPNDKCLYLQAIFEYTDELSEFAKSGNYHIELVKNI